VGKYKAQVYEQKVNGNSGALLTPTLIDTYTEFDVTEGSSLSYINVVASPSSVSAYENFDLVCTFTDGCSAPMTTSSTIYVSSSTLTLYGTLMGTSTTSGITFPVYATALGTYSVNVTIGAIFGTASVTILTNSLNYISITPAVFYI
jgi:hypothetical protein